MRLHTRTKTTRDVALKRFSDKRFLLSIFSTMLILASTLTATSSASAAPSNPIGISETILSAGDNHVCDITTEGIVRCWGSNLEGQTTPPENLGTIKQISSGATHTCAIKTDNTAQCWGSNTAGQSTPPANLGTIKQISVSGDGSCAIKTNNTSECWGKQRDFRFLPNWDREPIKQISAGGYGSCAITTEKTVVCWSNETQRGFDNAPTHRFIPFPAKLVAELDHDGQGLIISVVGLPSPKIVNGVLHPAPGNYRWSAWDYSSGTLLCQNITEETCRPAKTTLGKTYRVKVFATNDVGTGLGSVSASFKNCSSTPSISTSLSSSTPTSGSRLTISGRIVDFCPTYPSVVYFRERQYGKSWTGWSRYYISSSKKFSFSKYYPVPTELQFKATNGNKQVVTASRTVNVKPGTFKYSLTTKRTYTKQGFAQGGILTYKLSTGRGYNGMCAILADTDYAFNFALTPVGEEHKIGSFKMRNGYGSGTLQLRWNGVVSASISCESAAFPDHDFLSIRNVTLRTNF
jgi:hypothetical protein